MEISVSGCVTPYQSSGFAGGFSETQLGPNMFKVRFKGNAYTSPEKAADYTLLRCAELTLAKGFHYFIILNEQSYSTTYKYRTPTHTSGSATATTSGGVTTASGKATSYGGQTIELAKPRSENLVQCFQEEPSGVLAVYDASFLQQSLRAAYGLPSKQTIPGGFIATPWPGGGSLGQEGDQSIEQKFVDVVIDSDVSEKSTLKILSPLMVEISFFNGRLTLTGVVENISVNPAQGAQVQFWGLNDEAVEVAESTAYIGSVEAKSTKKFKAVLMGVNDPEDKSTYAYRAEFRLVYNNGMSVTGSMVLIQ